MESRELLCRIKAGDDEAFRTMVLTYGKPVYLRLLERSGNKEVAKEALREALIDLYITVKMANSKDPVEALLYSRAEEIQADMLRRSCERLFYTATNANAPEGRCSAVGYPYSGQGGEKAVERGKAGCRHSALRRNTCRSMGHSRPAYGYGLFALYRHGL